MVRLKQPGAALAMASLACVVGLGGAGLPAAIFDAAAAPTAVSRPATLHRAQTDDEPQIEQVGEGTADEDLEPLDEGAPPAEVSEAPEALDSAPIVEADDEDIELLDQGSPPPAQAAPVTTAAPAPAPAATADSGTVYVAPVPARAAGFALPEGFGTGRVQVSTGRGGFPRGLEGCHVGAVTGRAYVGINCGNGDSFVGHAPTFDDFPWVTAEDFPFDPDSRLLTEVNFPFDDNAMPGFFPARADTADSEEAPVVVSAGRGTGNASIGRSDNAGNASVELAQRARERDPRARISERNGNTSTRKKQRARGAEISVASVDGKDKKAKANKGNKAKKKQGAKANAKKKDRAKAKGERKEQKAKAQAERNDKAKKDKKQKRERRKAAKRS